MKREQVLSIITKVKDDPESFLELIEKHRYSKDAFNIAEFFQTLSKKQHSVVWDSLLSFIMKCVTDEVKSEESASLSEQLSEKSLCSVIGVVEFCVQALSLDDPVTPDSLRETMQVLHDILLTCLEATPMLQNRVCELLECWWCGDREGKEGLVPHCLLYLVARTLSEGAKMSDVKRVWVMRKAFLLLDFEDPTSAPFKTMLLACTLQRHYLKSEEGRKFLSFLFGLHPVFVEETHQAIKNQIPLSSKALLEIYAEIYFRAWRLSSGPYLQQIEEHCLQDFMYSAVHAPRTGPNSLFHALRKFLGYIHQQRSQKGVSEMLLRLYSPFLWRSLKVAHPHVRANAAGLLLDAFPLQDPDSTREQIDTILQKQFDVMVELLGDSAVLVRVTAVRGVCRILSSYFEMVPLSMMKTLVGRLVKELAWDASAIDVRVAVLQGLCVILDNRLSHTLLKDLLPLLHPLLHDTSEKVRLAFLELLLLVKGMRTIKFWHISPTEHLLARMEVDSIHVGKRIVSLLVDAFKPSSSQKIERCILLLRLNPGAARRFYQLAGTHLSPGQVVHLILAIRASLLQCIEREGQGEDTPTASDDNEIKETTPEVEQDGWKRESPTPDAPLAQNIQNRSETEDPLSLSDSDLMCGLLDVMVVLWEVVKDRLDKSTHQKMKQNLTSKMAESLPIFFNTFTDGPSRSALYLLSSNLPPSSVEPIVRGTFQTLTSLQQLSSKTYDHTPLLVALVSWQQTGDVIKVVNQWLSSFLSEVQTNGMSLVEPPNAGKGKTRRGAAPKNTKIADGFSKDPQPLSQSMLALDILSWMMCHPFCMQEMKKRDDFWELSVLLKRSMGLLGEHYFSTSQSVQQHSVPFNLLRKALSLYLHMCIHRRASEGVKGEVWFAAVVKEVLTWCVKVILPALAKNTSYAPKPTRHSNRKRKVTESHPASAPPSLLLIATHAEEVAEDVLSSLSEMLLVGMMRDSVLEKKVSELASNFTTTNSGRRLLPSLSKLLYQLCEVSCHQEVEGISAGPGALSPTATLLASVLSLLHRLSLEKQTLFTKFWPSIRQCVNEAVIASLRTWSLSITPHPLETYSILVKTLIQAQLDHIKTSPSFKPPATAEDLPTFVGCVLKQVCKDAQSTSLFGGHLHDYLSELEELDSPKQLLLVHQSSLQLLHVLSKGKHGREEIVRCVKVSVKYLEGLSDEERERWDDTISELTPLIQTVQERIHS